MRVLIFLFSLLLVTSAFGSQYGKASYYGYESGTVMANGKHFNPLALTAAHNSLPFGTKVRVTNLLNMRTVTVIITDRGGFEKYGRIIDLSLGAARKIGAVNEGIINIKLDIVR